MLYINGRFLSQPQTGVQRYAWEISSRLQQKMETCFVLPENVEQIASEKLLAKEQIRGKGYWWEQFHLPSYLQKRNQPLLLNLANMAPLSYFNQIVCIHDMAVFANPDWFPKTFAMAYRFLLPRLAKKSKKLLTVSEFSKNEIIKYLKVPLEKIVVIPNGMPEKPKLNTENRFPFPYILTIGGFDPRKNVQNIIKAIPLLEDKDLRLVIAGRSNSVFGTKEEFKKNDRLVVVTNLTDDELDLLMLQASVYVQASFYEGFGLPPMEALAAGKTLALSDIPVFREIYDGYASFFDPKNPLEIAGAIEQAIGEGASPNIEKLRGNYGWDKSVGKLSALIKGLE